MSKKPPFTPKTHSESAPPPAPPDPTFDEPARRIETTSQREPGDDTEELLKPEEPAPGQRFTGLVQVERNGTFTDPGKTTVRRDAMTGVEIEANRESAAVAAKTKAMVAARTLHALSHPRSFDEARARILRDCERSTFAEKAVYKMPARGQGGKPIVGLSIRFAEAALAHWGNVMTDTTVTWEDDEKRVTHISVMDLETNVTHENDITTLKRGERRNVRDGQTVIDKRIGSAGQPLFLVQLTDDEVRMSTESARARVLRTEALRLLPPDIKEEALALCLKVGALKTKADPDAARKAIADAFMELNISPSKLTEYLGCELNEASPAQLDDLRLWFVGIRDGDTTWPTIMQYHTEALQPEGDEVSPSAKLSSLRDTVRQKAEERKAAKS